MRQMTTEEKIKHAVMQHSVEDAIRVLENNPVQPDMVVELTIAQVMNRVSIAHLSIERAMKFLIMEAGGPLIKNHDLPSRLNELRRYDPDAAQFVEEAFGEAVRHYRYNTNVQHMKHLRSLETYLDTTGRDKDFQDIRYWELTQSTNKSIVREIYILLHVELLHAVWELLMPAGRTRETVSLRVETAVIKAMESQNLTYAPGTARELEVKTLLGWLKGFASTREAMTKALAEGEAPKDDFTLAILKKAHEELTNAADPAVKYFAEILNVIPYQPRVAIPCVEWLGPEKYQTGKVSTPGGDNLGFIYRRLDGIWAIQPSRIGPIMTTAIANTQTDAQCFLASILTRPARAIVNGEERNLRIVGQEHDLFNKKYNQAAIRDNGTDAPQFPTHQVDFWDAEHGISSGDNIKIEVPNRRFEQISDVLNGKVTGVEGRKVSIFGIDSIASSETDASPT